MEQRIDLCQMFDINKSAWNLISPSHEYADFYNIPEFLKTQNSLHEIEVTSLECVKDKKILHLQSHICVDSISLAARGAHVTVVDFSFEALKIGEKLSKEMNISLNFNYSNVLDIKYQNQFDIIFLSYGALCWIPDIQEYFKLIHRALKPTGYFYFVDFHENLLCYDTLTNRRKYYPTTTEEPIHEYRIGSYASTEKYEEYEVYYWIHSVSDIINALINSDFRIDKLEEYDYLPFNCFPGLEKESNRWYFKNNLKGLPLLYSVKSIK